MRKLLILLLIAAPLLAQKKPKPPPDMPNLNTVPSGVIAGSVEVPQSLLESAWSEMTGKIVWKHIHRDFSLTGGEGNVVCWIESLNHPLPQYVAYDQRNLVVTRTGIDFDAPAGDLIVWKVALRVK